MSSLLSTAGLARASARHPWRTIGIWVVIFLLAGFSAAVGLKLTTDMNFTNNPESIQGSNLLKQHMPSLQSATETVVIYSDTQTVDSPAFRSVVQKTTSDLMAMKGLIVSAPNYYQASAAGLPQAAGMVSADHKATIIPVTFSKKQDDISKSQVTSYLDAIDAESNGAVNVATVGNLSINQTFNDISSTDLQKAELFGVPAALVILIVVFGALIAAGVPLILSVVAIVTALGLTALLGQVMDLSTYVENMITMIGLAVGIDYALFIVSRYREERQRGLQKLDAITATGGTASKAVLFSGCTVVLGLAGMLLLPTTIFRSMGAGAVLVVIAAVVAMLTLVPAILSLLGDRVDWPRHHNYPNEPVPAAALDHEEIRKGFWGRAAHVVMARPIVSIILAAGILIAASSPYLDLHTGTASGAASLPASQVKTGLNVLQRDFSAGLVSPVQIVVDGGKTQANQAAIGKLQAALKSDKGFVPESTVQWSPDGAIAEVSVPLSSGIESQTAYATIHRLRSSIVPSAFAGTHTPVYVSGDTAFNYDFQQLVDTWTPPIFIFVLGLSFVLLLLAFRSIVVPLKAIIMNLLSVGTSYGLMVLVFQKGYLHSLFGFQTAPVIENWIPIFLFCVLFGLSMDYEVFLLSRIREHYDQTHRNRESVASGLQTTGRLITGAALIMVVVFAGFAAGKLVVFQQLGFGLAVAILIDATVVRSILVPATMTLLGDWNWYLPSWLRWLPDLRIEGQQAAPALVDAKVEPEPVLADD